jgi:hypothetical protein
MSETKLIERSQLQRYFDDFTKRFLREFAPRAVDVELLEAELGDQTETAGARLLGITYEPRTNVLELALEMGDHRDFDPREVWVVEEEDGFISAFEIVSANGLREVITVKRVGLRRLD